MNRPSHPMRLLHYLHEAYPGSRDTTQCAERTGLNRRQVSDAAGTLVRLGFAERVECGDYRLSDAGIRAALDGLAITSGPHGPGGAPKRRRNTLRQRAWRALRISRRATVPELLVSASRQHEANPENNLRRYLRALKRVGYVVELSRREPGQAQTSPGFKDWLLLRDTGPHAPVVRGNATVYDPNTGETHSLYKEEVTDELA